MKKSKKKNLQSDSFRLSKNIATYVNKKKNKKIGGGSDAFVRSGIRKFSVIESRERSNPGPGCRETRDHDLGYRKQEGSEQGGGGGESFACEGWYRPHVVDFIAATDKSGVAQISKCSLANLATLCTFESQPIVALRRAILVSENKRKRATNQGRKIGRKNRETIRN